MKSTKNIIFQRKLFGERLRELRKEKGYTTQTLAEAICTSSGYISEAENGKMAPGAEVILSLSRVLGVSTDWLLMGAGPPPPPMDRATFMIVQPDEREGFVNRFNGLLKDRELPLAQAAWLLGLPDEIYLAARISGAESFSVAEIVRLAYILGTTVEYLLAPDSAKVRRDAGYEGSSAAILKAAEKKDAG